MKKERKAIMNSMTNEFRNLSTVPRWPIVRTIQQQSVAEHSYFVGTMAGNIAAFLGLSGDEAMNVIMYGLMHDIEEAWTGDVPSPIKKYSVISLPPDLLHWQSHDMLPSGARFLGKLADKIEGILFLKTELQMGNESVRSLHDKAVKELIEGDLARGDAYYGLEWHDEGTSEKIEKNWELLCFAIAEAIGLADEPQDRL